MDNGNSVWQYRNWRTEISNGISSGKKNHKYLIGYVDDYKIKPFRIIPSESSTYLKVCDVEILKKFNNIWMKFSKSMKKETDPGPI